MVASITRTAHLIGGSLFYPTIGTKALTMHSQIVILFVCVLGVAMAGYPYKRGEDYSISKLLAAYLRAEGLDSNGDEPVPSPKPNGDNPSPNGKKPSEKPTGRPFEKPSGKHETPNGKPSENPSGGPSEKPSEKPVVKPEENKPEDNDYEKGCSNPCAEARSANKEGSEFFECAFRELKSIEDAIRKVVKDNFGEELFSDEEMNIVWDLRSDWKLSTAMKEVVEVVFMELAETRYEKYDWESLDEGVYNAANEKLCQYYWLRQDTFNSGIFSHKPDDE